MSIVGTMRARLGLDSGPFNQGLRQARGGVTAFAARARAALLGVAAAMAAAFSVRAIGNVLGQIDAQAKLAKSLGTTSASMQVLARAGELAGVSVQSIEQGSKDLFRRLSQAATGSGAAADALKRLGLTAGDLLEMPLDQRIASINSAIQQFIPSAQQAAVAGALFGEEGALAITRLDAASIRQATEELSAFGFTISETDASKIEEANDAMSRLALVGKGLISQVTVALAPALTAISNGMASLSREGGIVRTVLNAIGSVLGAILPIIGNVATILGSVVGWFVRGASAAASFAANLGPVRALFEAIIQPIATVIGGIIRTIAGFANLVRATGGFGEALAALAPVAQEVWARIGDGADYVRAAIQVMSGRASQFFIQQLRRMAGAFRNFTQAVANGINGLFGTNLQGIGHDLVLDLAQAEVAASEFANSAQASMQAAASSFRAPLTSLEALRASIAGSASETTDSITSATEAVAGLNAEAGAAGNGSGGGAAAGLKKVKEVADETAKSAGEVKDVFKSTFVSIFSGSKKAKDAIKELLSSLGKVFLNRAFEGFASAFGGGGSGRGLASLLPSFDGGGFTGSRPRTGGLDGRGGFLGVLHGNETVVDHTRPQSFANINGGSSTATGSRDGEIRAFIQLGVPMGVTIDDVRQISGEIMVEGVTANNLSQAEQQRRKVRA